MIETILLGIFIFALIWPYFVYLDVLNFKKDPNIMETQLPGRPARRTIGRKNEDVSKAIAYVFVGYALTNISFYGLLDYQDLLPSYTLPILGWVGLAMAMFLFSPANRTLHAYANLGHIAIVHFICSITAFLFLASIVYNYQIELMNSIYFLLTVVATMFIFNEKPNVKAVKKSQEEVF
jgi:uncharacterized protein (DUF486 family)